LVLIIRRDANIPLVNFINSLFYGLLAKACIFNKTADIFLIFTKKTKDLARKIMTRRPGHKKILLRVLNYLCKVSSRLDRKMFMWV